MKKLIYVLIIMIPFVSFSNNYEVFESLKGIEIKFNNIWEGDSLILPNYLVIEENNENFVKLDFALKNNDLQSVKLDNQIINYRFFEDSEFRGISTYSLIISSNLIENNSKLEIVFKNETNFSKKNSPELNLFPTILNKKHLRYLLNTKTFKKNNNRALLNDESQWYDYNKNYLKVTTNSDEIYRVNVANLIQEFGNVEINNIHIKLFGEDYENFYIKSDDAQLTNDDEFYLLGQIAKGDTTYYNHYTDNAYFYIYVDENKTSNQLELINSLNGEEQDYVERNLRYEEDKYYSYGDDYKIITTENNFHEGWHTTLLETASLETRELSIDKLLFPYNNEINVVSSYFLQPLKYRDNTRELFGIINVHHLANNKLLDSIVYTNKYEDIDKLFINNYLSGINQFKILSENFINNKGFSENGNILVDYFTFKGKFYPVAENGNIEFFDNSSQIKNINASNFNSQNIISIDTIQKTIQFISGIKSDFVSGGLDFESDFSTLVYNDTAIYSNEENILLIYKMNNQINTLITNSESEVNNIVNTNPEFYVILSNIVNSTQLRNNLNSKGFNIDNNTFIATKFGSIFNSKNLTQNDNNYIANLDWDNAEKYSGKISLKAGENHIFSFGKINYTSLIPEKVNFANLRDNSNQADFLFITTKAFKDGVEEYKRYRESTHENFNFKIIYLEDILNEFGYGQKTPFAIKDFLKYAYENWSEPKLSYVHLIGETTWDPKKNGEGSRVNDIIPIFGVPISDVWYTNIIDSNERKEEFYISRITATSNEDIYSYIEKLKEFEKTKFASWIKKFLFLIGGSEGEKFGFKQTVEKNFQSIYNSKLGIDTTYIETAEVPGLSYGQNIRQEINNGVFWVNFVGHGSVNVFDLEGWNENQLNNFGRTGILSTVSCNTNAFGEPITQLSRNEAFVMYPKTGFIYTYGGTTLGNPGIHGLIVENMMVAIADRNLNIRNVSELKKMGTKIFENIPGGDIYLSWNTLGDPLIELPISKSVELFLNRNEVEITSDSPYISILDSTFNLKTNLYNNGFCTDSTVVVKVIHTYFDEKFEFIDTVNNICNYIEYDRDIKINGVEGVHSIEIILDPFDQYTEEFKDNNRIKISFNVFNQNLLPIEPKNNWNISSRNPEFRFYDPSFNKEKIYHFRLENGNETITSNMDDISIIDNSFITWKSDVTLSDESKYTIYYKFTSGESLVQEESFIVYTSEYENNLTKYHFNKDILSNNSNMELIDNKLNLKVLDQNYILNPYFGNCDKKVSSVELRIDEELIGIDPVAYSGMYFFKVNKNAEKNDHFFKYYDTWDSKEESIEFYKKLKDSTTSDEYVFLVSYRGLNAFYGLHCKESDPCYIDSVLQVLKEEFHISADTAFYNVLFGYSLFSNHEFNKEQVKEITTSDTCEVFKQPILKGDLKRYYMNEEFSLPFINDVKEWYSFVINGYSNDSKIDIYIINQEGIEIDSVINYTLNDEINLESYGNERISFKIKLEKLNYDAEIEIENIIANYKSFPELGIIKNSQTTDSLLRGNEFFIDVDVKNYSLRNDIEDLDFKLQNNNLTIYDEEIEFLPFDSSINFKDTILTNNLLSENIFKYNLNSKNSDLEPISSNNSISVFLNVYEDTIPPTIIVYANEQELFDQAFITDKPIFTVELYDNSKLPINEIKKFKEIRFNSRYIEYENVEFFNNFNYLDDGELKARIRFEVDTVEFGNSFTNFIQITAQDATGNESEVEYYLNLSRLVAINNFISFPNPFEKEISVKFDYKGFEEPVSGELYIYDLNGRLINSIELNNIKIGENIIEWNGLDINGNSISEGNYLLLFKLLKNTSIKETQLIQKSK